MVKQYRVMGHKMLSVDRGNALKERGGSSMVDTFEVELEANPNFRKLIDRVSKEFSNHEKNYHKKED